MFLKLKPLLFVAPLLLSVSAWTQDVLEGEDEEEVKSSTESVAANVQLVTETVKKIAPSQRIFILSNTNATFGKGDYLTLIMNNELVVRVLCAKQLDDIAGIKLIKVYSAELWQKVKEGTEVQVLRGDDSLWKAPTKEAPKEKTKIKEEEDLYNETTLDDETTFDENKNRAIKPDNLVSLAYGMVDAKNNDGSAAKVGQFMGTWAYQVTDNIWAEAGYGQSILNDYPSPSLDTKMMNFTLRLKYALTGPLYTYFLPYVGYQMVTASSPGAGVEDPNSGMTEADYIAELDRVEELKKNSAVVGVTVLKRLVPGWFIRADLGTDVLGGGITLEF